MTAGASPILIHVPKSGGTTLVMAVTGGARPPRTGESYRHVYWNVDRSRMHSNAGNLFTAEGAKQYAGRTKILTVRRPIDRLESEFGFLSNREEFRDLWQTMSGIPYPGDFRSFVSEPGATDAISKFLLGRDLYDPAPVETADVDRILDRIDGGDFVLGLTEEMPTTIRNIQARCGIQFPKTITRHRTSLYKPDRGTEWSEIEKEFDARNQNDRRLHDGIVRRFEAQVATLPNDEAPSFQGDRYDSVFLFLAGGETRTPMEIFVNELSDPKACYAWITERREILLRIQRDALQGCDRDPRRFLVAWLHAVGREFPELEVETGALDEADPLADVRRICRTNFDRT